MPQGKVQWIEASWPAPAGIRAGVSGRTGGYSNKPYTSLNLALHVDDQQDIVDKNRQLLTRHLELPNSPLWLQQVHGKHVINARKWKNNVVADASFSNTPGEVCAILTADCVPLLLCDKAGKQIAAIHVGWRGFCENIIHHVVTHFDAQECELLAWIGPYIRVKHYEVGNEVYNSCLNAHPGTDHAFKYQAPGKWLADLGMLVRHALKAERIVDVYGDEHCSYDESERFYSYRREKMTGRMATMIWISEEESSASL